MSDQETQAKPGHGGALGRGVMLVIGLLAGIALAAAAGIVLLGLGRVLPNEARDVMYPSTSTSPSPSASAPPSAAKGNVPEPCVRSAQYNIEVDKGIDELAKSAQANDSLAVQKALDSLQDSRDKAKGAAEQCLAISGGTPSPSASPSAAPRPSKSAKR